MPPTKSPLKRYLIIDDILGSKKPGFEAKTKEAIIGKIEKELDVSLSESMFHKDIQDMKKVYGAPIKYDRYRKCYCYTQPEYSIRGMALTDEEKEALDYSTALFEQLKGTRMFKHFENAINKVIEGYRISEYLGKSEKQILQVEEPSAGNGQQWVEIILKNITAGKKALQIHYEPFERSAKIHEFSPYLLKEYRNRWYAIGYSNLAKNILVLALDRVIKITESKSKYVFNSDFKPEQYFKYSMGITQFNSTKQEIVELSFTPQQVPYVLNQPWHKSQKVVKKTDKETIIQLEIYVTHELVMAILACGAEVKVLKPARLVTTIKDIIKSMNKVYK